MPGPTPSAGGRFRRLFVPTLADFFFAALVVALFARAESWRSLLADGDTGWHIRTGEWILAAGHVPRTDLYSFSKPGEPWFAWEWGADVVFALLHSCGGLAAVAGFAAGILCLAAVVLFCRILYEGAGLWIGTAVTLAAVSASSIHYLARPHIFSLLLFPVCLWILAEDRVRPTAKVWLLVPLNALWANLHGGFAAWLAVLALAVVTAVIEGRGKWRRPAALLAGCSAATLANPYGWRLHCHIAGYLGSSWIQDHVQEFQSPRFRSENMLLFSILLLLGLALLSALWAQGRWFDSALILFWAWAALRCARHVPLYAMAAAPLVAGGGVSLWRKLAARANPRTAVRILCDLSQELGASGACPSLWLPVVGMALVWFLIPAGGLADFPAERFPVAVVARHAGVLAPDGKMPRILTSDQWADYLVFHLYPRQRVFFDGRSDFYGPTIGADYQTLFSATGSWREALDRYRFEIALLPADWPLAAVLEREPDWQVVDRERTGTLLVRSFGIKPRREIAGCQDGEERP
jgi:hypothetical protein